MEKKRVALYCRVSTEEQVMHGYSLEAQKEALENYCKEHDLAIVGIYVDEGISGKLPASKRPQLQRLLADLDQLSIDTILFIKLDRWFRSVKEYYKVQEILDAHKVTWRAILEDYNTESSDGILKINIMLSVAQNEAERTSERIKFVFANKIKRHEAIRGNQPFGYKVFTDENGKKTVVKDEKTEHIVNDMFDHILKYRSARGTGIYINEKYGMNHWIHNWINALKMPAYTGRYRDVPDYYPPYITVEQHNEILRIIADNTCDRKSATGRVYIFAGRIKCPICGHPLSSSYMGDYQYYRCSIYLAHNCSFSKRINESKFEEVLLRDINKFADMALRMMSDNQPVKNTIDKDKYRAKLKRITNAYINGDLDEDEYQRMSKEIHKILNSVEPIPEVKNTKVKEILNMNVAEVYSKLDREHQKLFWKSNIKNIYITENREIDHIDFV